ncbi:MAG: pyrimidine dimer DNA glycosylase/endonuclease V [Candidatus Omnitrophica bacterium]|nr:pyrimidine dimer DNA glycosylase/endonuclease V [Candidatus Omnitrophota bacterium]
MRIWDIPPKRLCNRHLLGEHRELHAIWSILTNNKKGYSHHPETMRWKGKLAALYIRHTKLVKEMLHRGYCHLSPLNQSLSCGGKKQTKFVDTIAQQRNILRHKKCNCRI